ncbi:hypothetical protein KZ483_02645 [Paenibacillus sp. sptzw28]|uniref:hypothetical protein n=1 Tax=Paenibacillus sp. sptzw28 TaxID=715179 RepID=UPI001C6F13CA|nr:hypothetical protein [Paenibacillus sp. sptzw28]QYR21953.1 hypothetical protein KZ483_02645 [Paenibacillus sp. sptzw28]
MRDVDIETLLHFGVMGVVFIAVMICTILHFRNTNSMRKSLLLSIGVALLLYGIAGAWWFSYVSDGLAQVFGVMFYGIAFVVTGLVSTGVLLGIKKAVRRRD